eukprot:jgi/Mesvir1/23599/Mv25737-RA.1
MISKMVYSVLFLGLSFYRRRVKIRSVSLHSASYLFLLELPESTSPWPAPVGVRAPCTGHFFTVRTGTANFSAPKYSRRDRPLNPTKEAHAIKDFALKRTGKLLGILTFLHVEVLEYGVEAALGELGLLAEVKRLPLELGCDGGGGGGRVVCCLSMSAQVVMGGASPARPAGAGLAAMSFTAWAVRPAVFCRTSIAMALSR